jgi:predicted deacylase
VTVVSSYVLGDLSAAPGFQARGYCQVNLGSTTVSVPAVVTHGSRPGPVLAITAGIHGAEYVPILAVRQFVRELDPSQMQGTIVACLQSSPVAFQQRTAFVNPLDGQNLNRSFPGDPAGSPTARLAAWLWANVIARADYYVDCHCGDLPETLAPFARVSPGPDGVLSERSRALAGCFDVDQLVMSWMEHDTVGAASLAGIPAVLVEVGGEGRWSEEEVDIQRRGLHQVAQLVGVLPGGAGTRPRLPVSESTDVLSEHAGLWFPDAAAGTTVVEGTCLGRLEDPFGAVLQEVLAPIPGVHSYGLSSLAAVKGDLLASIARPGATPDRGPGDPSHELGA